MVKDKTYPKLRKNEPHRRGAASRRVGRIRAASLKSWTQRNKSFREFLRKP